MPEKGTSQFFNSYSRSFDAIYGSENTLLNIIINGLFRRSMRLRFIKTIEGCEPIEGRSVIDVGCGSGHYAIVLAQRGAKSILGIDFAKGMIELADGNARLAGVEDRCNFVCGDFLVYPLKGKFDYSVVVGFMDYIEHPEEIIKRVLAITKTRAFFSFPLEGGILARQRKIRYRRKCDLFLYKEEEVCELFVGESYEKLEVERISRDLFVTVHMR